MLTPELLAQPARHAVRVVAAARLAHVRAAHEKLDKGRKTGLHALRVSLRRLRTWIRAFRPELDDTLRKKTRRGLGDIAKATNEARDAEVALAWIATQEPPADGERTGLKYLVARLRRERAGALQPMRKTIDGDLPKLARALDEQLATYWEVKVIAMPVASRTMSETLRDALLHHAARLSGAIGRIDSSSDFRGVHAARIAAKRLRYLLEACDSEPAAALTSELTALQDLLGTVHDAHRITNRIVRELGECAARDARRSAQRALGLRVEDRSPALRAVEPGMQALARRARAEERRAFASFRRTWPSDRIDAMRTAVAFVAGR